MVVELALTPVTTPVPATTVAMVPSALVQVPPLDASVKVIVELIHTLPGTLIVAGNGLTVTTAVVVQLVDVAVKVMMEVPGVTPVTKPDPVITVATAGVPLLQVPPPASPLSEVVKPWHTLNVPVMAVGNALTVITFVLLQPPLNVYIMVVVPAATPVTLPNASTVAVAIAPLLQVPPVVASVKLMDDPIQT